MLMMIFTQTSSGQHFSVIIGKDIIIDPCGWAWRGRLPSSAPSAVTATPAASGDQPRYSMNLNLGATNDQ